MKDQILFYVSPTPSPSIRDGSATRHLDGFLSECYRWGWTRTNKKFNYKTISHPPEFDVLLRKMFGEGEAELASWAFYVASSMAYNAFDNSTKTFNGETHPFTDDRVQADYHKWKEYMFGVKDWDDLKHTCKSL